MRRIAPGLRYCVLALAVLILGACGGQAAFREGRALIAEGRVEEGLLRLESAVRADPANPEYRLSYLDARDRSLARFIDTANRLRREGQIQEAAHLYRRVLALDPEHAQARAGLAEMIRDDRHRELLAQAETAWARRDAALALAGLRAILAENPQHERAQALRQTIQQRSAPPAETRLAARLDKAISIEFKDIPIKNIFEVISRTAGINFVFDKDVRGDQKATVFLRDSSIQEAINIVLLTSGLEQRVLDKNSILIYPNTAVKARDYQPLTMRTFFLSNSDVKSAANTVKTMVKTRDMVVDERQNMLIIRDTPEAVRVAERLLALHDLPEPEVMLEVEILEVKRTRLLELGIRWPDKLTLSPLAGASGVVTLADLQNLNAAGVGATLASMAVNAKKTDSDVKLLANPRIRTRSRETAKVLIGDRVPNITTTAAATGFVSESIQYVEVGLKLDVQPTIYADNEIAIKLALEVSSIVNQLQTKGGSIAYQIGTRTTSTVLRLKDGENQVLAGLINNEERSSAAKVPGLGELPLLGRLFGSQQDENQKTEIVLSITPRLIRNIQRPALVDVEFDSGTENAIRMRGTETVPAGSPSAPANPLALAGSGGTAGISMLAEGARSSGSGQGNAEPAPGPAGTASFRWQGATQAKPGDTLSLDLLVQTEQPLTSLPYSISYDPAVLEVVAVNKGSFLEEGGAAASFSSRVDRAAGQIYVAQTRTGSGGAAAPGTLANVVFRAVAPTSGTRVQVLTAAPVGLNGRAVTPALPAPHVVTVGQ